MRVIAIDGPGGSGKSTVSRALSERLCIARLDTGAMYRAVALLAVREGADLHDEAVLTRLAKMMQLEVNEEVTLDGIDVSCDIRTSEIDHAVPFVARQRGVREELVRRQREWAIAHGGGVVEGRDIGSVVFPDAELKIYLTASAQVRADRRARERVDGEVVDDGELEATKAAIEQRDSIDSTREDSPLQITEGAIVIDSSASSVDEIVNQIMAML